MRVIPLTATPNQAFTLTIDSVRWSLTVKETRGVMAVSVSRNDELILSNTRALAGEAIIPYRYLQTGNFVFITVGGAFPHWSEFGLSQILVYLSSEEMGVIPAMTAGEMNALLNQPQYLTSDGGFYLTTDGGDLLTDD